MPRMDALAAGSRRLLAGIRQGNAGLTLLGALVAAYGLIRRLDGPRQELIYSGTVRRGQSIEIAVTRPGGQRTR